jgi:hypothetical protein
LTFQCIENKFNFERGATTAQSCVAPQLSIFGLVFSSGSGFTVHIQIEPLGVEGVLVICVILVNTRNVDNCFQELNAVQHGV